MEPSREIARRSPETVTPFWCWALTVLAAVTGLGLLAHIAWSISSTYDEVTYRVLAVEWWRGKGQERITRMGSPLLFWKLQMTPFLFALGRLGEGDWIGRLEIHQGVFLPIARASALWIWLIAFGVTAAWSRRLYGPRAMIFSAWLFALSPNVLAHGSLLTMELPIVAAWTSACYLFWIFLNTDKRWAFLASAIAAGIGFSCKFTAVFLPPLLTLAWAVTRRPGRGVSRTPRLTKIIGNMLIFTIIMILADIAVTGFAVIPLSANDGDHPILSGLARRSPRLGEILSRAVEWPIPQDWVGFATQINHQRGGGASYLLGERRMTGWWYYYFVALAVKTPLTLGVLVAARAGIWLRDRGDGLAREMMFPVLIAAFLAITAVGSTRNYGIRYLLPISPLAIVWFSRLAEGGRLAGGVAALGVAGAAFATFSVHPNELTYFNGVAGGQLGGRRILADSNLDWGQGLVSLERLQRERPEFRDLTLYYFGSTLPHCYQIAGLTHVVDALGNTYSSPNPEHATTEYTGVSASLAWGPWGSRDLFDKYRSIRPVAYTDDTTIAIYRTADIP